MAIKKYDAIIIGAGSVGLPAAYFLTLEGWKVLVLDGRPSPGQGENKAAIGGVRATHSDPAKITLCLQSLEIFSTWKEKHGTDIGWIEGGYCFPVFRVKEEKILKGILPIQKSHGLHICHLFRWRFAPKFHFWMGQILIAKIPFCLVPIYKVDRPRAI